MDPVRYFYSTDGTDVHGPVTNEGLRLLIQNQVVGPASYLCREGETEWRQLNPEVFKAVAPSRPKPYEPPPYVPTPEALERLNEVPEPVGERSSAAIVLKWASLFVGLGAAIALVVIQAGQSQVDRSISYHLGAVTGAFLFLWGLPALISMIFKGLTRHLIRLVSITALAMLTIVGALNSPVLRMLDTATAFQEKMKEDARKQIAEKGYYAANPDQAENDLKTLEAQTTGDSTTARAARDMFTVTHTFIDKVKASNDAEKACNFDVVTIASTDDIAHRRDLLMNLRVTQVDVVTYLQDFDTHCRDALAHDDFSPDFVDGVLAGARKSGHVDMLITLWQSKIKLTDDYVARLDYLGKSYGAWNVKDGKLVFTDSDGIVAYNGYIQALQNDVKAIGDEQKQIVQ